MAAFESLNTDDLIPTKLELLKKVAGLNRGALASSNDKYEVSMAEQSNCKTLSAS